MNIIDSKWFSILVLVVLGWLGISLFNIKAQNDLINKEIRDLELKIGEFEKSNIISRETINLLENPKFIEQEARERLNYKSSDEEVVVVFLDESVVASGSVGENSGNKNLFFDLLNWLIGIFKFGTSHPPYE